MNSTRTASTTTLFTQCAGAMRPRWLIGLLAISLLVLALPWFFQETVHSAIAAAPPGPTLTIGNYRLVGLRHFQRLSFDYLYQARVKNSGATVALDVAATIKTAPSNVTVIDGGLTFGDVPAGGSKLSRDTFTIRKRILAPFNPNNLVWTIGQHQNLAPTAEAGPDQTVPLNATAQLDGSASSDPDGDPLTYQWTLTTKPSGSSAALPDPTAVNPTFLVDKPGTYVASLKVKDGKLTSAPDTVSISTANSAPVANAGADRTVKVGTTVQLDGSGSRDVDGNALTYRWELTSKPTGSSAALAGPTSVNASFRVDKPGIYSIELIVHDGTIDSAADLVLITTENSPPTANAGAGQSVPVNTTVILDGSGSTDVDGDPLTYTWSLLSKPAGSQAGPSDPAAVQPTFLVDEPGTYVAQLIVHDAVSDSDPATVIITTENSKPIAAAGADQTVLVGNNVALDGSGSTDADHDPLTYQWALLTKPATSTATLSDPSAVSPLLSIDKPGTYVAQLIVNDGPLDSDPDTVTVSTLNSKPAANAGPDQSGLVGATITLDGSGSLDGDGDSLTYAWSLISKPANSATALSNAASQTPTFPADQPGLYIVQLIIHDGHVDSDPDTVSVTITAAPPVNQPPVITSTPVTTATVGQPYSYDVDASDPDAGDILAYALTTAPAGMVINATSGLIEWTPTAAQVGDQSVTVQVTDTGTLSDTQTFTITVQPAMVTVPDVVGATRAAAEAAITSAGLSVGTVTEENSAIVPAGNVISQVPAAGSSVPQGAAVALVISLGPTGGGGGLPPDPATVAPPVATGVATILGDATAFLYSGANPIQTGVAPGTIVAERAAVVRGRVLDKNNQPLSGVTITVLNHSEFGQTLSRADGMFDMAVNGGGSLTIKYAASGFLPAQRQINVPWQDYVPVPDVVLIPRDSQVTTITANAGVMQFARGNVTTDADGGRQAMLLIPAGTTAQILLPGGGTQPVSNLDIRLTEYTVGPNGPAAMPAALPPTSGYTYAVEISADQAVAKINGKDVLLSQPVFFYLENFLNFPVGQNVPTGFYDNDKGAWVPSQNGKVIKILSLTGGFADLDVTGDDVADSGTTLSNLGITGAELQQLAVLHSPGQTLWRVPVTHLSTWDYNWPFGPPDDATGPQLPNPASDDPLDDPTCSAGSVIECENQILGETAGLVGTPYTLNYRSVRVPGRSVARTLRISLSGPSVPASLQRIELGVQVAGRTFQQSFAAGPNQQTLFTWDGLDAYGRTLQGGQLATVNIGYVYDAVYKSPAQLGASFARFGGTALASNRARREITVSQSFQAVIGVLDARAFGLGGWSLSSHHFYDPVARVLHQGNGGRRSADSLGRVITTIAGTNVIGFSGDGGPGTQAALRNPQGVAVGPDGSVYIADSDNSRIRRVGPDRVITTVAGNGVRSFSGDGGLATQASLVSPQGVAVGPDGGLYIVDTENQRIRRVGPDGVISTVAGNGVLGFSGDGGPAIQAALNRPRGVAVGSDGSLYIADVNNQRIRQVGPDGIITTVAGNGGPGFSGDGGPAIQAPLIDPKGVAVGPDGSLYIADDGSDRIRRVGPDGIITTVAGNCSSSVGAPCPGGGDGGLATQTYVASPFAVAVEADGSLYIAETQSVSRVGRIRRVGPDGIITTVAGNGAFGPSSGDGGPATRATVFQAFGVAVGPDGTLYIAESSQPFNNSRIRRVGSALSGLAVAEVAVASEDGSQLYVFDGTGRHLRTLDALTGAMIYGFTYDSAGRLAQVIQKTGDTDNVTTIQHDNSGNPTGIIGPFGQQTTLRVDANGFLASIANPANETIQLGSTTTGLLTSFINPRGKTSTFSYDADGRLLHDADPAGGSQSLARTATSGQFTVVRATALSRNTTYKTEDLPGRIQKRTTTAPDGTQAVSQERIDGGTTTATTPDGTVTNVQLGPDPRFAMQSPVASSLSIVLPSGPTLTAANTRTSVLTNPRDPLTFTSLTATSTIAGRTTTSTYTASTKTQTTTTPAGRTSSLTIDSLGRLVSGQIAGIDPADFTYDSRGRIETIIQGSGLSARTITFSYNPEGFLQSITDPIGRTAQLTYDAVGRVISKTFPDGRIANFSYDTAGNMTSLTPPGRPAHSFTYSDRNELTDVIPPTVPGAGPTSYSYNLDKQLTTVSLPDSRTITLAYDTSGRLATRALATSGVTSGTDTLSYDSAGRLSSIAATSGVTTDYAYNGSRLTAESWSGLISGSVTRSYDTSFRLASQSVNGANTIAFSYDNDDLLIGAGDLTITRNPQNGLPTGSSLGVVSMTVGFDGFGELTSYNASASGNSFFSNTFIRDALGRLTQKTETIGGVTAAYDYAYDTAGQLTGVSRNSVSVEAYGYDDNGNRISATVGGSSVTASYDDQDRLNQYGSATYAYNGAGDLLTKTSNGQVNNYEYDQLGNLLGVTLPNGTAVTYVIDGNNRRVGKEINGTFVKGYLYSDGLRPAAELDSAGTVVSRFVYAETNVPVSMIKGGVTFRIISDQLGSVRLVVNSATGAIVQRMDYDSFGNVTQDTNPGFQPFGFAGGIYDSDTGFVRFGARDYEPASGRWTAKDPLLFAGGQTNLYTYVFNDPVNLVDPSGLGCSRFFEAFKKRFVTTNEFLPGLLAPTGLGLLTGGAVAESLGIHSVLTAARHILFQLGGGGLTGRATQIVGFSRGLVPIVTAVGRPGLLTLSARGALSAVGSAAIASAANFIAVAAAFEAGIAVGSLIGAAFDVNFGDPPDDPSCNCP